MRQRDPGRATVSLEEGNRSHLYALPIGRILRRLCQLDAGVKREGRWHGGLGGRRWRVASGRLHPACKVGAARVPAFDQHCLVAR